MSITSPPPEATPADSDQPLHGQATAMLSRLAEMAMRVAGAIEARVVAAEGLEAADAVAWTLAFGRAARAVRLSLMLQARLVEQAQAATAGGAGGAGVRDGGIVPTVIKRIIVDPSIRDETGAPLSYEWEPREAEGLASDRLEREGLDAGWDAPFSEAVARVRRDLGIAAEAAGLEGLEQELAREWNERGSWAVAQSQNGLPDKPAPS